MSKGRLILAYILLVGLPLTGLLGILHAGQRLSAPASVGGAWYVDSNFDNVANDSCRHLLQSVKQPFMSISQSGSNLVISLNNPQKTALPGAIQGASLTMSAENASAGGCSDPQAIHVDGTIGKQGGQRVLAGTLAIAGCPDCAPVQFHAVRQSSHGKEGL